MEKGIIRNLQELTGQESGIVVYNNGEAIICNWSSFGDYELPKIFEWVGVIGWEEEDTVFNGCKKRTVKDFMRMVRRNRYDIIYDANGDMDNPINYKESAVIYTLSDGTQIIAPEMWN